MQLYTDKDLAKFKEIIGPILDTIEDTKGKLVEPTYKNIMKINKVVLDYIKESKRKIYGGYAQNKLISAKDPRDAFYKENTIQDIDFYSPDPIGDLKIISNRLYDAGIPFVHGKEAVHTETYKVTANYEEACDITYVPRNVYHRIPFVEIDGLYYTHPSFTTIDIYREWTEPYFSSRRWEKTFPRLYLLQKHYPLNKATRSLKEPDVTSNKDVLSLVDTTYNFLKNNKTIILFGRYAYNYFLEESGILKSTTKGGKYKILDIPYYEFISTNYKEDVSKLVNLLTKKHPQIAKKLVVDEHYPFWQFWGYSSYIRLGDTTIAHIIHYNRRCTPIKEVPAMIFKNNKTIKDGNNTVQLGSFTYSLLQSLISGFRMRVIQDTDRYTFYNIMGSHLAEMRNYYLEKNKLSLFDKTIFQEFNSNCIGDSVNPMRESLLIKHQKFLKGVRPIIYKYDPVPKEKRREGEDSTYRFANSSGNSINKESNFKIVGNIPRRGMEGRNFTKEEPVEVIEQMDINELENEAKKKKKIKKE